MLSNRFQGTCHRPELRLVTSLMMFHVARFDRIARIKRPNA